MAAYAKKKTAAKKKKRAAKRVKEPAKKKARARAAVKKTRKRVVRKATRARKVVKKARARAKKAPGKKRVSKKRTRTARRRPATKGKPKKVSRLKKPGTKKAGTKKKAGAKKKKAGKKTPSKTRALVAALKKANRELQGELASLKKAEQAARPYATSNPRKTQIRAEKRRLTKARVDAIIAASNDGKVPRRYRKKLQKRDEIFETHFQDMREILERARADGELPPMPKTFYKRKVSNEWNVGSQRYLKVNDFLFEEMIEPLLYRARRSIAGMPQNFKLWLGTLTVSAFGEKLVGSGIRLYSKSRPEDMMLQTQGFESTGSWNTSLGMLETLETVLYRLVQEKRTVVFLHYIRLYTYTPRRHA